MFPMYVYNLHIIEYDLRAQSGVVDEIFDTIFTCHIDGFENSQIEMDAKYYFIGDRIIQRKN